MWRMNDVNIALQMAFRILNFEGSTFLSASVHSKNGWMDGWMDGWLDMDEWAECCVQFVWMQHHRSQFTKYNRMI